MPHILIFSFVPRATKGRDTTACALSWTWYELTRHPEIVVNIVDEVRNICGVGDEADFSFDTMNQLK